MNGPTFFHRHLLIAPALLTLAALVRFWIAPELVKLPADYASETHYTVEDRSRTTPDGSWETASLIGRRVDQALTAPGENAVVQGDLHWTAPSGRVIFEATGLYGVNRRTRENVPGYGDTERTGQFLFPPHSRPTAYPFWDPMFIGPRTATFERTEVLDGLLVYVYRFSGTEMDETAGYSYLPDVPRRYRTHTDGQGTLWIEPTSGVVVDYEEQGISFFVDAASGQRIASFYEWRDRYTPETRAAQFALATAARARIVALESGLPAGLAIVGGLWLAIIVAYPRLMRAIPDKKPRRGNASGNADLMEAE